MFSKYDKETHEQYILETYRVVEVAEHGEEAESTRRYQFDVLPPMEKIANIVRTVGCDTFEIIHVTEKVERYSLNNE